MLLPIIYIAGSGAADACASIIAALFIAHSFHTRQWAWLRTPWFLWFIAYWSYMMTQGAWATSPNIAWKAAIPSIRFPLFAMACATWLLPNTHYKHYFFTLLRACIFFLISDTILQYFLGFDVFGRATYPAYEGGQRLTGPFSSPRVGIILTWLGLPIILYYLLKPHTTRQSFIRAVGIAIAYMTAIFLSGERMAFLLAGFGGCIALITRPFILKKILLPCLLTLTIGGIIISQQPDLFKRQIASTLNGIANIQHTPYGMIWTSASHMITDNPIFGVGARHFRIACPNPAYGATDAETLAIRCNLHPHNAYLEWLTEGGILGLCFIIGMLFTWCKHITQQYKTHAHSSLWLGIIIGLFIRLWPLSTGVSLYVGWSAVPFWLLAGWMLHYTTAPDTTLSKETT